MKRSGKRLVISLSLAVTIPVHAFAQERVTRDPEARVLDTSRLASTSKIPMVRGRQGMAAPDAVEPDPPPPELTTIEKSTLLADLGKLQLGMVPWKVTPDKLIIPGRVAAHLRRAIVVHPGWGTPVAAIPWADEWVGDGGYPSYTPGVTIALKPEALGRKYLLDCTVGGAESFSIAIGSVQVPYATIDGKDHLLLVYEALDLQDAHFLIAGEGRRETNYGGWNFYGCEVSRVQ